jgi:hypothetical protein
MATKRHNLIATAILSSTMVFGGLSVAAAHHGDVSEHSTTKLKSLGAIEKQERRITAELNRKAAEQGPQLALNTAPAAQPPAAAVPMPEPVPGPDAAAPIPMPAQEPAAQEGTDGGAEPAEEAAPAN